MIGYDEEPRCPECDGPIRREFGYMVVCNHCGWSVEIDVCPQDPQYVDGPEADYIYTPPCMR